MALQAHEEPFVKGTGISFQLGTQVFLFEMLLPYCWRGLVPGFINTESVARWRK